MKLKKWEPDDWSRSTSAAQAALTTMASAVNTGLGVAVGMSFALFGPAIERRRGRAEEMINFVGDNLSQFVPKVLNDEVFQDGFVYLLERYIRERNKEKRTILRQILLGYIKAPSLLDFPLEEFTDLVNRIRMSDIEVLKHALDEEKQNFSQVQQNSELKSFMLHQDPNAVSRLIYFGLLHEDRTQNGPQIREHSDKNFLYVWVSPEGRAFAEYLLDAKQN